MRKVFVTILLATTAASLAAPASAQRRDREDRSEEREDRRSKRSDARTEKSESRQSSEQKAPAREARPERPTRAQRSAIIDQQSERRELIDQRRQTTGQRQQLQQQRQEVQEQRQQTREQRQQVQEQRLQTREQRQQAQEQRQQTRQQADQQRQDSRDRFIERAQRRVQPPAGARPDRPAPPPPATVETSRPAPNWSSSHWRRDDRYDWRRWRDRNRSLFRLGLYFDPFGWGYHRFGIGWRMWPSYYSQNYWLDDPWMYRLPYAPWPYRWVRYYDDAVLVNVWNGQVVDVIYGFFW